MRGLVVVRAESRFDLDAIDYIAFGEQFETVEVGLEPPEYQAIITQHENGEVTCRWERVKDWRRESPTKD